MKHAPALAPAHGWLASVDLLRAVAAIGVVICHVVQQTAPKPAGWNVLALWLGGWGVSLFFIISGFCIHLPQARRPSREAVDWKIFFRRRARRLLPPHYVALALSAAVGMRVHTATIGPPQWTTLLAHIFMVHPFFGDGVYYSINCVFWSIGIEVHFYILYPVYLSLQRRIGAPRVWLLFLVIGLSIYGLGSRFLHGNARFISQHTFIVTWWQWALGAWLAELHVAGAIERTSAKARRLVALVALAASLSLAWTDVVLFGLHVRMWILPCLCGLIMAALVPPGTGPRIKSLEYLGEASYSIYLTHPIAIALVVLVSSTLGSTQPILLRFMDLMAAMAFGLFFFYTIERHFLNTRHVTQPISPNPSPSRGTA
jgi:peptidoglycan/LPS O-acetylase OafA/YrhL